MASENTVNEEAGGAQELEGVEDRCEMLPLGHEMAITHELTAAGVICTRSSQQKCQLGWG